MEAVLHRAEEVTENDMNNNPVDDDLPEKLKLYKVNRISGSKTGSVNEKISFDV